MSLDTATRFWSKVDKTGDCWMWTAAKLPKGYGRFGHEGSVVLAHRMSYMLTHGAIPSGHHVDHACYNPSCVRPTHLRAVTPKENIENRSGLNRNNTSGARGVTRYGDRYVAQVKHLGAVIRVGVFDSLEEASEAARLKRAELFTNSAGDTLSAGAA